MRRRFLSRKVKLVILTLLLTGSAWALQQWTVEDDVIIRIDGKAVQVIDGDSFRAGNAEYRIYGIDAPEYRQTCKDAADKDWACGKEARSGLEAMLRQNDFSCNIRAKDQFGRMIAICLTDGKIDLGSALVEQGHAVSGENFVETIYAVDEKAAKDGNRGIWKGEFVRPDVWRKDNPRK